MAALWPAAEVAQADTQRLESPSMLVEIDPNSGRWSLVDKASGVRWPSEGAASAGSASGLEGPFQYAPSVGPAVRLVDKSGAASIAEHLHEDVGIRRCLFMMGGRTEERLPKRRRSAYA
jgi:hypothetical protein